MYKLSISIFLVGWFYKMIILSWKKYLIFKEKAGVFSSIYAGFSVKYAGFLGKTGERKIYANDFIKTCRLLFFINKTKPPLI